MAKRITIFLLSGLLLASLGLIFGVGYLTNEIVQRKHRDQGLQSASTGAAITRYIIEKAIDNGIFDMDTLFDDKYVSIENSPHEAYHTGYDHYFDHNLIHIEQAMLQSKSIYYAYAISDDGYIPVHSNPTMNKRRLHHFSPNHTVTSWTDPNGFVYLQYSAPIVIKDRRWGEYRTGIPLALTRNEVWDTVVIASGTTFLFSSLIALMIFFVIRRSLFLLPVLQHTTQQVAEGNLVDDRALPDKLPQDEIGLLAAAISRMRSGLYSIVEEVREQSCSLHATTVSFKNESTRISRVAETLNNEATNVADSLEIQSDHISEITKKSEAITELMTAMLSGNI